MQIIPILTVPGKSELTSGPATYYGLQALRFFAAFFVLYTHATFYVSSRVNNNFEMWLHGAQGVPIFFVISGFVMALSARPLVDLADGYQQFFLSRLVRIVPLYWVANALKIIVLIVLPYSLFGHPDSINILLSLFFIPSRNANGVIETFYGVGWTLNFEMLFYLLFTMALWLRVRAVLVVGPVLILLAVLSLLRQPDWAAFSFFLDPIVLNFLWGMLIADYVMSGRRLSVGAAAVAVLSGGVITFVWPGAQLLGLQYAALVAGIIFLEPLLKNRLPKLLVKGGEASYALYLFHPLVGVCVAVTLAKVGLTSVSLAMVIIIFSSVVVAFAMHVNIELPVTRRLRRLVNSAKRTQRVVRTVSADE